MQAVRFDLKYVNISRQLRRKVNAQIDECIAFSRMNKNGPDTPYSTVVHRDLWANNFMISKGIAVISCSHFSFNFIREFSISSLRRSKWKCCRRKNL